MAIMVPERPRDFELASQEGLMFQALSLLSDDYYVFHSFRLTSVTDNTLRESETDFVIYNKNKGLICLEAKAGQVKYENGVWLYGSGIQMHHGGPFNQASSNKYKLMRYIENSSLKSILSKCKFLHAVWFPSISEARLRNMNLPSEADKRLVLTQEALTEPERFLNSIYSIEIPSKIKTSITDIESTKLIKEILCPEFSVFPSMTFEYDMKKIVFHRLLKEQAGILNFLDEQKTAAINGAAGTGKTMIAVEKAHRHAAMGESVLFLCYNAQLKGFLQENYAMEKVTYYTIAGFACSLCDTTKPDYMKAQNKLEDMYISGTFLYKNVIIDEGQDLGNDNLEETRLADTILEIVTDNSVDGTFYVFYDKLQLVQSSRVPRFIEDLDCRLTLYRNCRNTENIAVTSLRPVTERTPKLFEGAVKGVPAKIHFCNGKDDEINRAGMVMDALLADGVKDIVILTCKTETESCMAGQVKNSLFRNKYLFTSCRKYKGLEADSVILVDVDVETFSNEVLLYYVGASRARFRLDIITSLSDYECITILNSILNYSAKIHKPKKDFASALNAIGTLNT